MSNTTDYAYQPKRSVGPYLRLSEKGQSIRIRIASAPFHFEETFNDPEKGETVNERFAWVVIHKEVGEDKKVVKTATTFKGGPMIYGAIRDLAMMDDWGDPKGYDLTITRTEEKGKYYTVVPSPNGKPLSDEELKMIADADFNLKAMYCKDKTQNSHSGANGAAYDPYMDSE